MAGAFGFESGNHYDVSIQCGERALLPAVRQASKDTLIIADGFSCREQISQTTDWHALHLAEVLQMAIRQKTTQVSQNYPEQRFIRRDKYADIGIPAAIMIAAAAAGGLWFWKTRKR
jgi:hypothetical protein